MNANQLWALSLCAGVARAFRNSSPFFAFSNQPFSGQTAPGHFVQASHVKDLVSSQWSECATRELFVVVSQPGVSAEDYQSKAATPYLRRSIGGLDDARSRITIPEVVGSLDADDMAAGIARMCGIPRRTVNTAGPIEIEDEYPQVLTVNLPRLHEDRSARQQQLEEHDATLNAILEGTHPRSHTVFYVTTPPSSPQQGLASTSHHLSHHKHGSHKSASGGEERSRAHPERVFDYDREEQYPEAIHMGLKRDVQSHAVRDDGDTDVNDAPLFEKYNFLNKGIFMGGLVFVILLSILYVGLSAVGSVEITPFAFSKEMGPQNQRKQG